MSYIPSPPINPMSFMQAMEEIDESNPIQRWINRCWAADLSLDATVGSHLPSEVTHFGQEISLDISHVSTRI
jgi:hypothetical protein